MVGDAAENAPDHHLERQRDFQRRGPRDAQVVREERSGKPAAAAGHGEYARACSAACSCRRRARRPRRRGWHAARCRTSSRRAPEPEDDREHRYARDVVIARRRRGAGRRSRHAELAAGEIRKREQDARERSAGRPASRARGTSRAAAGTDSPRASESVATAAPAQTVAQGEMPSLSEISADV